MRRKVIDVLCASALVAAILFLFVLTVVNQYVGFFKLLRWIF